MFRFVDFEHDEPPTEQIDKKKEYWRKQRNFLIDKHEKSPSGMFFVLKNSLWNWIIIGVMWAIDMTFHVGSIDVTAFGCWAHQRHLITLPWEPQSGFDKRKIDFRKVFLLLKRWKV